jgi:hypothetical protein
VCSACSQEMRGVMVLNNVLGLGMQCLCGSVCFMCCIWTSVLQLMLVMFNDEHVFYIYLNGLCSSIYKYDLFRTEQKHGNGRHLHRLTFKTEAIFWSNWEYLKHSPWHCWRNNNKMPGMLKFTGRHQIEQTTWNIWNIHRLTFRSNNLI